MSFLFVLGDFLVNVRLSQFLVDTLVALWLSLLIFCDSLVDDLLYLLILVDLLFAFGYLCLLLFIYWLLLVFLFIVVDLSVDFWSLGGVGWILELFCGSLCYLVGIWWYIWWCIGRYLAMIGGVLVAVDLPFWSYLCAVWRDLGLPRNDQQPLNTECGSFLHGLAWSGTGPPEIPPPPILL